MTPGYNLEAEKEILLRSLAARSHSGTSGKLPLKSEDADLSFGGRYWVEVKEIGGAVYEDLSNVAAPTFIERDTGRTRQEWRMAELLHKMVELRLIVGMCIPWLDEDTGEVTDIEWPEGNRAAQHKLINDFSPLLLMTMTLVINKFYRFVEPSESEQEVEEAVMEDVGNSSPPALEQATGPLQ